jgi:hypothetical protein
MAARFSALRAGATWNKFITIFINLTGYVLKGIITFATTTGAA